MMRTRGPVVQVVHYGPSTDHVGGMASVIAALVGQHIGADRTRAVGTYVPGARGRSAVATARGIGGLLRSARSVIAHVHMSEGGSFIREGAVVLASSLRGGRTVVSIHGPGFATFASRWPRLVRSVLLRADVVTVLSDVDFDAVRRAAPQVDVTLLPNPTAVDEGSPPADETAEIALFAGEIGYRKGADVLEEAWASVARVRPSARCVLVGPLAMNRLPRGERLEVLDPVNAERIRTLIRAARVVVLPSRAEALPMILTEAMAGGRPFVSTPVGGTPSLGTGGLLVDVEDADALAAGMIELLGDARKAREIGERGRAFCRETRSAEVIDRRLRAIYTAGDGKLSKGIR